MRIFSNLAVSLDGRIADASRPSAPLGTTYDRSLMDRIRRESDVIVFGANTLRAHPHALRLRKAGKPKARQPANAVVTGSGELDPNSKFWDADDVVRFVFTTDRGYEKAVAASRDRAFVVKCGKDQVEIPRLVDRLKASGLKRVLVEGGGELLGGFLRAKLMHEMYVTITPWLLGGGDKNPSLVGGAALDPWTGFEILKSRKLKNEIYLHLKVKAALKA